MVFLRNKKALLVFGVLFVLFSIPIFSFAQSTSSEDKVYNYDTISAVYTVSPDTTVSVEETQIFNFISGEFHQGWREIPKNKIDGISDIGVTDVDANQVYSYSRSRLDKTDPSSWGKYTTFDQGGKTIIEWYYNGSKGLRTWKLHYTLHGAIGFFSNADELYINVFDSYTVPVKIARASVVLPRGATAIRGDAFRTDRSGAFTNEGLSFSATNFAPNEAFTIQVSWPKGFINRAEYVWSFLRFYYGIILLCIFIIGSISFSIVYILIRRRRDNEGRGTIIPEYEPPKNLRPLVAQVITKGYVTDKGLSATIVDLAVRGYVTIEEDTSKGFAFLKKFKDGEFYQKIKAKRMLILLVIWVCSFIYFISYASNFSFGFFLILFVFSLIFSRFHKSTDYFVKKVKNFNTDNTLEDFEKSYLNILFSSSDIFSTRALRMMTSYIERQGFASAVRHLKTSVVKEVEGDTKAYMQSISRSQKFVGIAIVLLIFSIFVSTFLSFLWGMQTSLVLIGMCVSCVILLWTLKYRTALSKEGRVLREEWLGFKLYLKTAEKYRLENLTPETFEKFLPYAMVFGLEKKWARAFQGMDVPPPHWYHGAVMGGAIGSSPSSSFSPASFGSSFSASFSSAFSSSTGSSGGGGSAGGGGGGGGGGAS